MSYRQIAGDLALDFVNTLGGARGIETTEYVPSYPALVAWGQRVGLYPAAVAKALTQHADEHPAAAAEVLARAYALREATYRAVTAEMPAPEDLFLVSREATFAMARAKITPGTAGLAWQWDDGADLDRVLWPVARAAADLLTSPAFERVHECASGRCTWVFVDTSKNQRRRWCDMKDCGNREKVRRWRRR